MRSSPLCSQMTRKPDVIPGGKFALPVTWVRGIKLRLFAFSSVAASHDSFATGLRSGRPIFLLPLLPVVQFRGFSKMTFSSLQALSHPPHVCPAYHLRTAL